MIKTDFYRQVITQADPDTGIMWFKSEEGWTASLWEAKLFPCDGQRLPCPPPEEQKFPGQAVIVRNIERKLGTWTEFLSPPQKPSRRTPPLTPFKENTHAPGQSQVYRG